MGLLARMSLLSLHTYADLVPDVQYAISENFLLLKWEGFLDNLTLYVSNYVLNKWVH